MTRKHFVELASILKSLEPTDPSCSAEAYNKAHALWEEFCEQSANFCNSNNSFFDRHKFLVACGYYIM